MTTDAMNVLNAALGLPEAVRLEIAHGLYASIASPDVLRADAPDVAQQIVERIAQFDRGEVELIEHDEAMRRVRAALAARKQA